MAGLGIMVPILIILVLSIVVITILGYKLWKCTRDLKKKNKEAENGESSKILTLPQSD